MADDRKADDRKADDRKSDSAPGPKPEAAGTASGTASGTGGLRREPPTIDGKATELRAETAKPAEAPKPTESASPSPKATERPQAPARSAEPPKSEPQKPDSVKPESTRAAAPPPSQSGGAKGISAGTAALLGGVAGAALALVLSLMLAPKGLPQDAADKIALLEKRLAALPSVDVAALTKRAADAEAEAKAAAAAAKGAGETAGAAKAALAALPAMDPDGIARRLQSADAAAQALGGRLKALEERPVLSLAPVEAKLAELARASDAAQRQMAERLAALDAASKAAADRASALEAAAKEAEARRDQRVAAVEAAQKDAVARADQRVIAFETAIREQGSRVDARVSALEASTRDATAQAAQRLAALETGAKQAADAAQARLAQAEAVARDSSAQVGLRLTALDERIKNLDVKPIADKLGAVGQQVVGLDGRLGAVEKSVADQAGVVKSAVAAAQQREQVYVAGARSAASALAAEAIQRAVVEGRPYKAQLDALAASGVPSEALAPLKPYAEKGAPTPQTLLAEFSTVAGDMARNAAPPAEQTSVAERFWSAAGRIVQVRKTGEAGGTDAASLTSRIEAALERGDVAGASGAWAALPEPARRVSAAFGASLTGVGRAQEAARKLSGEAYGALAAPKN
jgi:hypothetical protein